MNLKKQIEKSPIIWFLSAIIVSYAAGFSTYEYFVRSSGRITVDKYDYEHLLKDLSYFQYYSRDEIKNIAKKVGMFRKWKINRHLTFRQGDITYWYYSQLNPEELEIEFSLRRKVIESAEKEGRLIATSGDLTDLANKLRTNIPIDSLFVDTIPEDKLNATQVKILADRYGLTRASIINPHLKFNDGDINFWFRRGFSRKKLEREFKTRELILAEADRKNRVIATQGDLSYLVDSLNAAR